MRIIADAPVREALAELLSDPSGERQRELSPGTLVAYANTLRCARWACEGLREVDRVLSDPAFNVTSLVVLSFESRRSIFKRKDICPSAQLADPELDIPFIHLPTSAGALKAALHGRAATRKWRSWKGALIRLEANGRLLDLFNADYRHSYKNLLAAVRILLGALQSEHVRARDAKRVLSLLAQREAGLSGNNSLSARLEEIIRSCRRQTDLISRVRRAGPPPSEKEKGGWKQRLQSYEKLRALRAKNRIIPEGYKILMLDNEYDTRGWKDVISAIAVGANNITYARDWNEAEALLSGERFDVMMLDYDLGDTHQSGLELLAPLRSFRSGLPVVMVTAYDNAELALWSLRAGCNDFYAKELEDKSDRASLDYYCRFIDVLVREDWEWERSLRELWRQFESSLPLAVRFHDDEANLRYAFYLLFSLVDKTIWWARGGMSPDATEQAQEDVVARAAVLAIVAADHIKIVSNSAADRISKRARHPGSTITRRNAFTVLEAAVRQVRKGPGKEKLPTEEARLPHGCRVREILSREESEKAIRDTSTSLDLGHLERSRLGAAQFVLGHVLTHEAGATSLSQDLFKSAPQRIDDVLRTLNALCKPVEIPQLARHDTRIVLIDDEGDTNGWSGALKLMLGSSIEWYPTVEKFLAACSPLNLTSCVILLDLWLADEASQHPSPEKGLRALKEIKQHDVAAPVIVLSAATDTLNAIKCMRLGALDYVPKWLPREEGAEQWKAFYGVLLERLRVASVLGDVQDGGLRALWRSLSETMTRTSPLQSCPQILERIENWETRAASGLERLAEIRNQFYQSILPALILYHSNRTSVVTNGEIPALDAWRVKHVLQTRGPIEEDVILFAGRTVELLGQLRCSMANPLDFTPAKYKATDYGSYASWINVASAKAGEVWKVRNQIKGRNNPSNGSSLNAQEIMQKAIDSLAEFESNAARDLVGSA